ncbi:MAG: bud neck involved protein [Geoglossum umbratile]|nr:MAG: bud neck involved protein [Geoglossum umbratile]
MSTIENSVPVIPAAIASSSSKPSPDRYRRNRRQENSAPASGSQQTILPNGSALPSGSGMAAVGHLYNHPAQSNSSPSLHTYQSFGSLTQPHSSRSVGVNGVSTGLGGQSLAGKPTLVAAYPEQIRPASVDDMHLNKQSSQELAKRYRRRSLGTLSPAEFEGIGQEEINQALLQLRQGVAQAQPTLSTAPQKDTKISPGNTRPESSHGRNSSAESTASTRSSSSRPSSVKQNSSVSGLVANPAPVSVTQMNEAKLVNIPPRGSSDTNKRLNNPSPLSRPMTLSPDSPASNRPFDATVPNSALKSIPAADSNAVPPPSPSSIPGQESRAAQQLAALNGNDTKRGVKSRLRRAFSFGSAAELRRASAENSMNKELANERAKVRKEKYREAQEAEQAAIARKQEAGGIGEGIYSGQGNFFTGSTDNISISSTASSASVMIRKMGQGMKKSTRSLVGLFRPKSIIGTPTMDSTVPEPSMAQVSMVTVEAERERVNVNLSPHDQVGGGTGFPKLERNSIDAANAGALDNVDVSTGPVDSGESIRSRKSIIGGEKERAEVLAAVKKGILKRSGTDSGNSSPVTRPVDSKTMEFALPHVNDTPSSSHPSTPADERPPQIGHKRTDSVTIEGEEYFMSAPRFSGAVLDSKSAPGTPQGTIKHNVNFSPRIQFHDTWPSGEYDRRGDIATCNRLTPMLAQQIKEELNTFKMEMEVHEQSKVYTHFF